MNCVSMAARVELVMSEPDGEVDTHAVPLQYCPEGQEVPELPPDVGAHAVPFQY